MNSYHFHERKEDTIPLRGRGVWGREIAKLFLVSTR